MPRNLTLSIIAHTDRGIARYERGGRSCIGIGGDIDLFVCWSFRFGAIFGMGKTSEG